MPDVFVAAVAPRLRLARPARHLHPRAPRRQPRLVRPDLDLLHGCFPLLQPPRHSPELLPDLGKVPVEGPARQAIGRIVRRHRARVDPGAPAPNAGRMSGTSATDRGEQAGGAQRRTPPRDRGRCATVTSPRTAPAPRAPGRRGAAAGLERRIAAALSARWGKGRLEPTFDVVERAPPRRRPRAALSAVAQGRRPQGGDPRPPALDRGGAARAGARGLPSPRSRPPACTSTSR